MFSCHDPISAKNLSYSNSTYFFWYPEEKRLEDDGGVTKPPINEPHDSDSEHPLSYRIEGCTYRWYVVILDWFGEKWVIASAEWIFSFDIEESCTFPSNNWHLGGPCMLLDVCQVLYQVPPVKVNNPQPLLSLVTHRF